MHQMTGDLSLLSQEAKRKIPTEAGNTIIKRPETKNVPQKKKSVFYVQNQNCISFWGKSLKPEATWIPLQTLSQDNITPHPPKSPVILI